ncbi:unnamed protein product, partial [Vitis vinifera]
MHFSLMIFLTRVGRLHPPQGKTRFKCRLIILVVHISKSTVPGQIHSCHLIFARDPQQFQLMQCVKQWAHCYRHPSGHHYYLNKLSCKQLPTAAHQQPVRSIRRPRIHLSHILLRRENRW